MVDDRDDVGSQSTLISSEVDATLPASGREQEQLRSIGRYQVLRMLGAGGMGVVYAAHDPELGRTVAIKLVRERLGKLGSSLRERLRREAQALARLTHPNVVSIHDVGVDGDQLYIVMQFVDGGTIDDWIAETKADRDGIIALYRQAGRGLAAAHAAGLVHRDFKPGNVLVERDGTVRVTDFGLARLSHLADEPSSSESNDQQVDVTRGDVVGTPAYMAPEQFTGGAITAATDQFGFCIALWEALAGARPFAGKTLHGIRDAVVSGRIEWPPPRPLPRRIASALRRGLAVKASDRFADMNALLAALAPPRRAVWIGAGVGVAVAGIAAAAAITLTGGHRAANPCADAAAPLDAVWSPTRRDALRTVLQGSSDPGLADDVVGRVDERAVRWRTMRVEVCEATKVRRTQPAAIMDGRNACLDRGLAGLRAALDLLGAGAAKDIANARNIVSNGADPSVCTAEAALAGGSSGTVSPELAARAAELMARSSSEDFKFIANEGPGIARAVEEAGDYTLAANAWFEIATSGFSIPNAIARDAARRASILAEKLGDHDLQARAWCWSAELAAEAGDFGGIDDMLAMASSAAEQTGRPTTLMYVEITRADVLEREGDLEGAAKICEAARARIAEANHALDSRLDDVLSCLGTTYLAQWRYDEAEVVERELLELRAKAYGPDSPMHLDTEMKLFGLEYRHDPAAASRKFHAAIARIEEIHGPESLLAMNAYSDLAITASEGTNIGTPEAIEASRKALAIGKKILDGHDPSLARLLTIDANIVFATDPAASMADYEQALAIYDHLDDLRHWAELAYNAADGFRQLDHCDRAVPLFERIVRLADAGELERTIGAASRGGLGVCQRILGDLTTAEVTLRSSVADLFALGLDDFAIQYKIELAEVVWRQGKKAAARAIAKEARDAVADDSETHRQLRIQAEDVVKRQ